MRPAPSAPLCRDCGTVLPPPFLDLAAVRQEERRAGLNEPALLARFAARAEGIKAVFTAFLQGAKRDGKRVAAYGAAAKGNTFRNSCGATAADIRTVFDRNPQKQAKLLPGSHIPSSRRTPSLRAGRIAC